MRVSAISHGYRLIFVKPCIAIAEAIHCECFVTAERCSGFAAQSEQRGIRTLVLKGPTLALDLYGDVSLRTSKDLDILIPLTEIEQAERLMTELGY